MVRQRTKKLIVNGPDSKTKFVFEVESNPQNHCGKQTYIYPTNYDSLYVAIISGDVDLISGQNHGNERNVATQHLHYIAPTTGLLNSMHTIRNTRPTKQVMKTCILIWTKKCTWEQNWTTSSFRAHEDFKLLRYNS